MPLYMRKYNDTTKQFEMVLEKTWKQQRAENQQRADEEAAKLRLQPPNLLGQPDLPEFPDPADLPEPGSSPPPLPPSFRYRHRKLLVAGLLVGLISYGTYRSVSYPDSSRDSLQERQHEQFRQDPWEDPGVRVDLVALPKEVIPPPPAPFPPPEVHVAGARMNLLQIPKNLDPEQEEKARAEAIAAEKKVEADFNEVVDPQGPAPPLRRNWFRDRRGRDQQNVAARINQPLEKKRAYRLQVERMPRGLPPLDNLEPSSSRLSEAERRSAREAWDKGHPRR